MKNGECPKCGGREIYRSEHMDPNSTGSVAESSVSFRLLGSGWFDGTLFYPAHYVCVGCGYTESYVLNPEAAEKFRAATNWKRV